MTLKVDVRLSDPDTDDDGDGLPVTDRVTEDVVDIDVDIDVLWLTVADVVPVPVLENDLLTVAVAVNVPEAVLVIDAVDVNDAENELDRVDVVELKSFTVPDRHVATLTCVFTECATAVMVRSPFTGMSVAVTVS